MMGLPAILAALERDGDAWRAAIPPEWLQGRTSYGGLSAALALHVAQACAPDLPPLRSAQVAFVGPLAGIVTIRASLLRRGRNAAFIQADVAGESGLGLRATFVFMAAIPSALAFADMPAPAWPLPGADANIWTGTPAIPFTRQFETLDRQDGLSPAEWLRWTRLRNREGLDPAVALLAVADSAPPAALRLLDGHRPLSSMTWLVNMLTPAPATRDGWWLLQSRSRHARDGASSQVMRIWDAHGRPVAEQMQSVAIFA